MMGEDTVLLLGQSAGGYYVLRGVRATAWVWQWSFAGQRAAVFEAEGAAGDRQGEAPRGQDGQAGDTGALAVAGRADGHRRRHRGVGGGGGGQPSD